MPMAPEQQLQDDDNDDFTFPTPPQPPLFATSRHHLPCSSPAPAWLLSSPIRRSFSAADCTGSPWRNASAVLRRHGTGTGGGGCSPALSDYAAATAGLSYGEDEEEEERMDSLWEDLNDDDAAATAGNKKGDMFLASLDVSRRRSIGGAVLVEKRGKQPEINKERDGGAALGASRSSRRRAPGLVAMMRSLRKMLVAHKGKSKVHKSDEHSNASASASSSSCSNSAKK